MTELDYIVIKELFRNKEAIKVGDIAKNLSQPHSTIGSCIKRLEEEGYVVYKRYKPVSLTEKGKDLAIELIRHSRLLELLLYNELDLEKQEAHQEAENFFLPFSCKTIQLICEKYGHPDRCPCGEKIMDSKQCFCQEHKQKKVRKKKNF